MKKRLGGWLFAIALALIVGAQASAADFNNDHKADLVWRNSTDATTVLWLMNGLTASSSAGFAPGPGWYVAGGGDFDGDGKTDLLWRNSVDGTYVIWLMNGLTITSSAGFAPGPGWYVTKIADFNGDGKADLLWRNSQTGSTVMWLMSGTSVIGSGGMPVDANWVVTQVGDFNGDGKADLVWRNSQTGATVIWLMDGTNMIASAGMPVDANWVVTQVGDFDGDGKADLVWRNSVSGETDIWLMSGTSKVSGGPIMFDPNWVVTQIADFNHDRKSDLVWRNSADGSTSIWLMNGLSAITQQTFNPGQGWYVSDIGDLDGDGNSDLVWRNSISGSTSLWLMNGVTPTSTAVVMSDPAWSTVPLGSSAVAQPPNILPTISLTTPTANQPFTAPATIPFSATASDADGVITRVDFLANSNLVGTSVSPPYTFSWTNVAVGSYQLAARATDNSGGTATSSSVAIIVANPPTVTLTAPPANQVVAPGTPVTVTAVPATDNSRSVNNVVLAAKNSSGTIVWSVTTYPCTSACAGTQYSATWTTSTAGNFTLTATVTDSGGATAVSPPVALTVDVPPSVSISADRTNAAAPATIHLTATATSTVTTIQTVTFYANAASVGTGTAGPNNTYTLTWMTNVVGTYSVTAKATDSFNVSTTSTPISITIIQSGPFTVYYHNDFAGSPLAATDSSGTVIWKQAYAPYGEAYPNKATSDTNPILFAGKPTEDAPGLSYFGGRWYNPMVGRFYSVDPQRFRDNNPLSFNRYAYADNNPYRFIDPNGHSPIDIGFLVWDLGKLGVALYNGSGAGEAAIDVAISAVAVVIPVPGSGLAIKAARAGRALEETVKAAADVAPNANQLLKASAARDLVGVGEYAGESIAARSAARDFTVAERAEINRIGSESGCHTCGTTSPGTKSGNFVPDHQPASALNPGGGPQRLYPQCINCSREQGLEIARRRQAGEL